MPPHLALFSIEPQWFMSSAALSSVVLLQQHLAVSYYVVTDSGLVSCFYLFLSFTARLLERGWYVYSLHKMNV